MGLSNANCGMGLYGEGIQQSREALEIFQRLGDTAKQAKCLNFLAWLLYSGEQFDAAEVVASVAINLLSGNGDQYLLCGSHQVLGDIYHSKGEQEKAISHFEVSLGIASSFNWQDELFRIHCSLARFFFDQGRFDDAYAHVEQVKSHAVDNPYYLGYAMELQANFWYKQRQFEEAKSSILGAADAYEKVGVARDAERCREIFQGIQKELNGPDTLGF